MLVLLLQLGHSLLQYFHAADLPHFRRKGDGVAMHQTNCVTKFDVDMGLALDWLAHDVHWSLQFVLAPPHIRRHYPCLRTFDFYAWRGTYLDCVLSCDTRGG